MILRSFQAYLFDQFAIKDPNMATNQTDVDFPVFSGTSIGKLLPQLFRRARPCVPVCFFVCACVLLRRCLECQNLLDGSRGTLHMGGLRS